MESNNNPQKSFSPNRQQSVVSLDQGRIPPQVIGFEEAVLGAVLIDNGAINTVIF
jgi:hypothetical protein